MVHELGLTLMTKLINPQINFKSRQNYTNLVNQVILRGFSKMFYRLWFTVAFHLPIFVKFNHPLV
jgi:hypothetical protein